MEQLLCPLCQGLSPVDAASCSSCGAVFRRPEPASVSATRPSESQLQAAETPVRASAQPAYAASGPPQPVLQYKSQAPTAPAPPQPPVQLNSQIQAPAAPTVPALTAAPPLVAPLPDAISTGWSVRTGREPASTSLDAPVPAPAPVPQVANATTEATATEVVAPSPAQAPSAPSMSPTAAPAPAPAPPTGVPGVQAGPRKGLLAAAVVLIGGSVVGLIGVREGWIGATTSTHTLVTPTAIASENLLANSSFAPVLTTLKKQYQGLAGVSSVVGGVYGTATTPQFIFIAEQGSAAVPSGPNALAQLTSGGTSTLQTSKETQKGVSGVAYTCAPLVTGSVTTAACVWTDGNVLGLVWTVSSADPAAAQQLAVAARTAAGG